MKLVELKNVTQSRLTITQVRGFSLDPGESTKVHPATVTHPAVARYLPPKGKGLELITKDATAKVEPAAPALPPTPAPTVTPLEDEPTAVEEETVEETTPEPEETVEEVAGKGLRDMYIDAPGITEGNVDGVLSAFPTLEELSEASKDALVDTGVDASYVKRVRKWAREQ